MDNRLPRLTAILILAAAALVARPRSPRDDSSPEPASSPLAKPTSGGASASTKPPVDDAVTAGDRLLLQAVLQLERRSSITARVSHRVFLRGRQLSGRGGYWQLGSGEDLRVRFELQVADQEASLLQIANSPFLWLDRRFATGRTVVRIDLRQLRADPVLAAAAFDDIQPGEASWASVRGELAMQSGGLPRLLAALGENFSFMPPQAMRLVPRGQSQSSSIPFFAVVGHWKPHKLRQLLDSQASAASEISETPTANDGTQVAFVPDRLPEEVLLLFGQTDLFPYRIEYRRLETPKVSGTDAAPIPYQLSANPKVVMEFSDVAFDVPIAAGQFDYTPRDVDWVDQTAAVLERLRRERQEKLAARAETAATATLPR